MQNAGKSHRTAPVASQRSQYRSPVALFDVPASWLWGGIRVINANCSMCHGCSGVRHNWFVLKRGPFQAFLSRYSTLFTGFVGLLFGNEVFGGHIGITP